MLSREMIVIFYYTLDVKYSSSSATEHVLNSFPATHHPKGKKNLSLRSLQSSLMSSHVRKWVGSLGSHTAFLRSNLVRASGILRMQRDSRGRDILCCPKGATGVGYAIVHFARRSERHYFSLLRIASWMRKMHTVTRSGCRVHLVSKLQFITTDFEGGNHVSSISITSSCEARHLLHPFYTDHLEIKFKVQG